MSCNVLWMGQRPLWLVGMMGAGKSVVGPLLARSLGRDFVDTDAEIETLAGTSVAQIFANEGEASFRERERAAIEALLGGDAVVALGGGAIGQPGVSARLAESGTVIYLRATPATLLRRLGDCAGRPLLSALGARARLARLEALLAERRCAYETASIAIDTDGLAIEAVLEEISRRLAARGEENGP